MIDKCMYVCVLFPDYRINDFSLRPGRQQGWAALEVSAGARAREYVMKGAERAQKEHRGAS